ncbi:uncharacterized protein LOC131874225 [Cryptomeria japonica]|uniref:uncharacterized protein LOC131874225 n=1 Tax=Cryptomeria japonica TaxID=3369 RepID=UPI0027DA0FDE|nr:uncharacterized protein LOC131874225 [Cryptomeria japonica]
MGDMSYRELSNRLAKSEEALDTLKGKYKASLAKRRELAKKMVDLNENSSSYEANMDTLVTEVEKLDDEKANLRRELEALFIRMIQELEARRTTQDKIREKEHEIFKLHQEKKMHARERIPTRVVKRYEDTIYFLVDTDTCQMEAVDPRITWVMPMGYKVEKDILVAYAEHLLAQPVDTTAKRFRTYKEKSIEVHSELSRLVISKKVRKEVEKFSEQQGFTKEAIAEAREKYEAKQARESSAPTGTSTDRQTRSTMVKEKPTKAKKEKTSKIQFKRKGKFIEPPTPKAHKVKEVSRKRKREQAKKPTVDDEEETESKDDDTKVKVAGTEEEKKDDTEDIQNEDVQMTEQQEH